MAQPIVRPTPVGYEEFYVLLERGLFNPAPVEHIHTCQAAVTRVSAKLPSWEVEVCLAESVR